MKIEADVVIPFPVEQVYAAYRDRMTELVPYLPNIRAITVTSRRDAGDVVELVNEWVGGGDIPKVVRGVLSESMLRWTDYATWLAAERVVRWRTEVHAFPGAVQSDGRNAFLATSAGTRLEIRGELRIEASKVPGVPRLLAGTVAEAAEKLIVGQVSTNLVAVARGVERLLREEGTAAP